MLKKLLLAAAAAAFLGTGAAAADDAGKKPPTARPRRTVLHFGEDDIRGDITRPDGELVQAPRKVSDQSLVRVRRSFLDRALAAPLHGR
ncbi:MAG: hypothetical protein E6J78_09165 [Deltaproteobacteria bacterium]|nr:MAG: hypothetical protein E6J78_09165 [Deltaproteobacteria bacterium]